MTDPAAKAGSKIEKIMTANGRAPTEKEFGKIFKQFLKEIESET